MVELITTLKLAGYAVGTLGAALLFVEFFQVPSYVEYSADFNDYSIDIAPNEVVEHTWIGRSGAFLLTLSFALQFFAVFLE